MKKKKKVFSSANLFFLCVSLAFLVSYYYAIWQRDAVINIGAANTIFLVMCVAACFYFPIKFPLVIKINVDDVDVSHYKDIYVKKLGFWSQLYQGFFCWSKAGDSISLFSDKIIKLGINNRDCKFAQCYEAVKARHRFCDFALTIFMSVAAFFLAKEVSKTGIVFGFVLATYAILFRFRNVILSRVFSVCISDGEEYKVALMFPYGSVRDFLNKSFGFAYYADNTILIHKDVFCGGEVLRKYIFAHEVGHLKKACRVANVFIISIFIFMTYAFFISLGLIVQSASSNIFSPILPLIGYLVFLCAYLPFVQRINQKSEWLADTYAINDIGKDAVLQGLKAIKDDSSYENLGLNFSGIPIDRRIKFVEEYAYE